MGRCISDFRRYFLVSTMAAMLTANAACAQPVSPLAQAGNQTTSTPPTDCGASPLSSGALVAALSKLIAHQDLTDVPFVEKTLGTTFPYPGPRRSIARMQGSLMKVGLMEFTTQHEEAGDNGPANLMAGINFPAYLVIDNYLHDCVRIRARDLIARFSGPVLNDSGSYRAVTVSRTKDGVTTFLAFGWNPADGLVTSIKLRQCGCILSPRGTKTPPPRAVPIAGSAARHAPPRPIARSAISASAQTESWTP